MNEEKKTHLDDVLIQFDLSGRYHLCLIAMIFVANMSNNLYCSNYIFVAEKVKYRCTDERFNNNTCSNLINSTEACMEWVYDDPHSFMAEFQLACQDWKRTLVGSVHNFGYMIGLLIVGPLSDRFGRKNTAIISGVLGGIFGLARSFTTSYWLYIVLEFIEASAGDPFSPFFILTMEMMTQERRVLLKMFCSFGFSFGYLFLALAAWLFPYWRHLLRVLYAPAFLFIFYVFLLDESPRWLLSKGKKDEAVAILKKGAKKNKIELNADVLEKLSFEENKGATLLELLKCTFKSMPLLKRFFICLTWWTTSSFVAYGLRINSVLLPGSKYVNYGLQMIIDILAKMMITYTLIKFRRKIPLLSCFIFAAIFVLLQPFVPNSLPWLSIALYMAGLFMTCAYFTATYVYTSELFPTYTRNSMHALCSSLGRLGSIVAPQTPLLMVYWKGLPSVIFGGASLGAGLATLFVPDTAHVPLPDTVMQAEALDAKHTPAKDEDTTCTRF